MTGPGAAGMTGPAQGPPMPDRVALGTPVPNFRGVQGLVQPRSVAVVGPTPRNPAAVHNLVTAAAPAVGVHPSRTQLLGLRCVPALRDLAEVPDQVVLLVGHSRVEQAFEQAVAIGVRSFVIPGIGAEAGAEGTAVAARLRRRADQVGAAVLGHNCMGIAQPGGSAWIGTMPPSFRPGDVAVLAQSGSIADAMIALGPRIGFRRVVSLGAELTRDVADFLRWQLDDPGTRAVGLFLETVRRPQEFAAALEAAAERGIPVVCLKVGRSAVAQRVAVAHTGAVVGSAEAFSAVLRRFNAIACDDFPQLVETLELLGRARRPAGVRVAAVSESGGECGLLADRAQARGLDLAPLPASTEALLCQEFPNFVAPQNPIDAWGIDAAERVFPRALDLLAGSGAYHTVIAQVDLSRFRGADEAVWCELAVRSAAAAAAAHGLAAAVVSVTTTDPPEQIVEIAHQLDLPLLRGIDQACFALAAAGRWRPAVPRTVPALAVPIDDLLGSATGALPEFESALVLERYGVPVAARHRARTPEQAVAAAEQLGYPVVVKLDGPAHKSRTGGVVLDLRDAETVRDAAVLLGAGVAGGSVLVARQVRSGVEVFCGVTRDPTFGPILAVGPGGSRVEAHRPVAALAPVDRALALELVAEAAVAEPGSAPAQAIAATLVALGRIALEHPEVVEVDVNPLIVRADGATAVDALVVIEERA
jgi:acyl-CoA synthetase (NDP forming)